MSPLVIRKCRELAAGESIGGHQHRNGHHAFLMRGRVTYALTTAESTTAGLMDAPSELWVPGGVVHDFTALENGSVVWCVFDGEAL
jgi:quercetin dioxygenase-like cupin family protein